MGRMRDVRGVYIVYTRRCVCVCVFRECVRVCVLGECVCVCVRAIGCVCMCVSVEREVRWGGGPALESNVPLS